MGLFDKLRNEFIDIIEWTDNTTDTIIWKFPRYQNEIKMGAKLTVRESQQAVFMNEGTIADVYQPGMYTLQTQNMPILATLKGWKYGFDSPFKADVFFVNTKQFLNQKWGTKNAITLSDSRFGMFELRAFGTFAFKVVDGGKFLKEVSGTNSDFGTEDIDGQLKSLIITKFTNAIGNGNIPIEKIAGSQEELSKMCQEKLNADFDTYGLQITQFLIENVSMPDDIKKEIFDYSRLNTIDMQKLTQFKAANSIETAAANDGVGGMGVGMGVGMGMGNMVTNAMANAAQQINGSSANVPPALPGNETVTYFVALNGQQSGPYNLAQLTQMAQAGNINKDTLVWKNGMPAWAAASSEEGLVGLFGNTPPPLPTN